MIQNQRLAALDTWLEALRARAKVEKFVKNKQQKLNARLRGDLARAVELYRGELSPSANDVHLMQARRGASDKVEHLSGDAFMYESERASPACKRIAGALTR